MRHGALIFFGILVGFALEALAAPAGVPGRLFMQGSETDGVPVTLLQYSDRHIRVFDRQVAYRNDRKACVRFELPPDLSRPDGPLRLELEAYNDDRIYLRALWVEVDGIGGYLAVQRVAEGQHRGSGTIAAGERKRWLLPLDRLPISLKGKASSVVNLDQVLKQPGPHTICAWISTYAKFGPRSWITLDLVDSREPSFLDRQSEGGPATTSGGRVSSRAGRGVRFSLTYILNEHGMKAYRSRDYLLAAQWFKRAAVVTPEHYLYPHTNLASSLALAGQAEAAIAQLRRACALDPLFTRSSMLKDPDLAGLHQAPQFWEILQDECAVKGSRGGS